MPYFNFISIACPALRAGNGRVYDPQVGAFLSPDPFVQAPYQTQSYNRYAYVFNNPMKYVDPSGYNAMKEFNSPYIEMQDDNVRCIINSFNYDHQRFSDWYRQGVPSISEMTVDEWMLVSSPIWQSRRDAYLNNLTPEELNSHSYGFLNYVSRVSNSISMQLVPYQTFVKWTTVSGKRLNTVYKDFEVGTNYRWEYYAANGGGSWDDGASLSISGAYASPFKATGSMGFSLGYYRGAKDGGFFFTAKKGKGIMLSLSLDGSYYINNTSTSLQFNHMLGQGEEWDVGYQTVGGAFSGGISFNGTPYYGITGSYSPIGLDYGIANWNTYTVPLIIDGSGMITLLISY